jgi:hypothetical protein
MQGIIGRGAVAVCALATAIGGWAAAAGADDEPRRLACAFTAGTISTYERGTFRNDTVAPLSFELVDIDLDAQAARIASAPGAVPGNVRVVRAINANHFLEVANEGFLNLTTIYDRDPATGAHPAIHSRHFGLLGQPVYAQYTGTCRAP